MREDQVVKYRFFIVDIPVLQYWKTLILITAIQSLSLSYVHRTSALVHTCSVNWSCLGFAPIFICCELDQQFLKPWVYGEFWFVS